MRIGTVFLILVAIIMGFGFLFSNNINLQQDLQAAENQIAETSQQKKALEEQLTKALAENDLLKAENQTLSQQKLLLEAQARQMQTEYEQVNNQNAQLQNRINTTDAIRSSIKILSNMNPTSLVLALFVPLLPISLAGNLLIYRNRKSSHQTSDEKPGKTRGTLSMQITKKEMKVIRQMRRNRNPTD